MTLLGAHMATYWLFLLLTAAYVAALWIRPSSTLSAVVGWSALGMLTATSIMRWIVTAHPPIFGTYENTLAAAWFLLVALVAAEQGWLRLPDGLVRWAVLWLPVIVGFGVFFERTPYPLTISERSLFVDVHVFFAWAAFTVLLISSTAALLCVFSARRAQDAEWDLVMLRGAGVGFVLFTAMIALGSVYSYLLFSDWYQWEIVGVFAAATWLGYALALHSRLFFGWRGRRLAWVMIAVLPLMIGTFWVWSLYSGTYHYFDIPEIRAM